MLRFWIDIDFFGWYNREYKDCEGEEYLYLTVFRERNVGVSFFTE